MLKHVKAVYKGGKLMLNEGEGVPQEGSEVVVIYQDESQPTQPQSLYGIWKGKFPEDLDLDIELGKIRAAWQQRLE